MNAEAPPRVAMTHIQKTAPAPPSVTAVATPAMLPTPTREAVDTISARNEETSPSSTGGSVTTRIASLNRRSGRARVRMKKYRPTPMRRATSRYVYMKPEIVSRVPARSKAGRRVPFMVFPSIVGCGRTALMAASIALGSMDSKNFAKKCDGFCHKFSSRVPGACATADREPL